MAKVSMGGGTMWLFSHPGNTRLIITAHGGKPANDRKTSWPPKDAGNPAIYYCSMHGKSTATQAVEILAAIAGNKSVEELIRIAGFHPYFAIDKKVFDYDLQKFAGSGSDDSETYKDYERWVKHGCDIVSPRNRWFSSEIRFSSIFEQSDIKKKGYKHVYCSFCRS